MEHGETETSKGFKYTIEMSKRMLIPDGLHTMWDTSHLRLQLL